MLNGYYDHLWQDCKTVTINVEDNLEYSRHDMPIDPSSETTRDETRRQEVNGEMSFCSLSQLNLTYIDLEPDLTQADL